MGKIREMHPWNVPSVHFGNARKQKLNGEFLEFEVQTFLKWSNLRNNTHCGTCLVFAEVAA